jgi:DNA-binding transcriptional ArsR family regulator
MFAGEIQSELGMQPSAVSHHLEKLKHEDLVRVRREGTYLRYTANPDVLQNLLTFLFSQCCTETGAVEAESVFQICQLKTPSKARVSSKLRETKSRKDCQ